jgi:hypothetical protein
MRRLFLTLLSVALLLLLTSPSRAQFGALIRGTAFHDLNADGIRDPGEPGLPETVICLVGHDWCDHTESGQYEFDLLDPGTYKVKLTEFPDGYYRTTPKKYVITLAQDEYRTDVHFGLAQVAGYRASLIRGTAYHDLNADGIRDPGELGLPETVICLVGHDWCDHTESGQFEFDMLNPGTYKVKLTEFPDGYYRTTPKKFVITLAPHENRTDVYFGLASIPGYRASLIRGWAFLDSNENGIQDAGEDGLADTVICLVGHNWCDHTEWGEFEFDMLNPGTYKVKLVDYPDGYELTTPKKYKITLLPDETKTDVAFGLIPHP